jgi:hypothetical protein
MNDPSSANDPNPLADAGVDADLAELAAPKFPSTMEYIGLAGALLPFAISMRSTHTESVTVTSGTDATVTAHTEATSFKDPVALAGGAVAIVAALVSLTLWKKTLPAKRGLRIALTLGMLVIGVFQLVVRSGLLN